MDSISEETRGATGMTGPTGDNRKACYIGVTGAKSATGCDN